MSFLTYLDPGDSVTTAITAALIQSSLVILLAALIAGTAFKRAAARRHSLWLGVLIWVFASPLIAALALRSKLAVVSLPLPLPTNRVANPIVEPTAAVPAFDPVMSRQEVLPEDNAGPDPATVKPRDLSTNRPIAAAPEAPRSPLTGGIYALWATGALLGLARIALGWRRARSLAHVTRPLDAEHHALALAYVRASLGVTELPPIRISQRAKSPVAVGLLQPQILLPEGPAQSISSRSLRDILVHECAHVVRRDAWAGMMQRLAGALFWPNPFVHYASAQLTRAREEVCDNHVIRSGDACEFARTLLALTTLCKPFAPLRPGLGLFAARWTLADRVAGLVDPKRVCVTRTSFQMKIGLGLALTLIAVLAASVRFAGSSQAGEPNRRQANSISAAVTQATPSAELWDIAGTVVDEQNRPVGGAMVRTMPLFNGPSQVEHRTAADGTFRFTLKRLTPGLVGLMAEADGGSRMGIDRDFDRRRAERLNAPSRIVLKPSQMVTVHVKDSTGALVSGATVEAAEVAFRTHTATNADGAAKIQIPADAQVEWVIGFKPIAGFDYFESYEKKAQTELRPLPTQIALTLEAAPAVRIKAIDSNRQPVPGISFKPIFLYRTEKQDVLHARLFATLIATTDRMGIATFDWLPKGARGPVRFNIDPSAGYSSTDSLVHEPNGPAEMLVRTRRATRLTGTVHFPDGRTAREIMVRASGWGQSGSARGLINARTDAAGRYALDVPPEHAYIVSVNDDAWAARSRMNVVVHEGQTQGGLDFKLEHGTVLRGQIAEGPDHRPSGRARVMLIEQGELLPKEFRGVEDRGQIMRATATADAQGRYRFRVGPGRYLVRAVSTQQQIAEDSPAEVTSEAEVVCNVALKLSAPETIFKAVVVERTVSAERPVPKARIIVWPLVSSSGNATADAAGRFEIMRKPGDIVIFAYHEEKGLAAFAAMSATENTGKIVIEKAATITGRVIDALGKPRARNRIGIRVSPIHDFVSRFGVNFICDEQGRYTFRGAPARSQGELSAPHDRTGTGRLTRARTVMPFDVSGADTIEMPDLIVPAQNSPE